MTTPRPATPGVDERIAVLCDRVFGHLEFWGRMALVATLVLGGLTWALALVAVRSFRSFPAATILLVVVLLPALGAWVIKRRANLVRASLGSLRADIGLAMNDPELKHLFDRFLDGDDDTNDGRAGLARLAKGALGVRKIVKEQRSTFVHLSQAVRAILLSPGLLALITAGMFLLAGAAVLFGLIAVL